MAAIVWEAEVLGTGVESIDEQHRKLIGMVNDLMVAMSTGRGKEQIGKVMELLALFAAEHFSHEEYVMSDRNCPAAAANRDEHAMFLEDLALLRARFDAEGPTLAMMMEVQKRVANRLTQHMKSCDTQLKQCVTPR